MIYISEADKKIADDLIYEINAKKFHFIDDRNRYGVGKITVAFLKDNGELGNVLEIIISGMIKKDYRAYLNHKHIPLHYASPLCKKIFDALIARQNQIWAEQEKQKKLVQKQKKDSEKNAKLSDKKRENAANSLCDAKKYEAFKNALRQKQ